MSFYDAIRVGASGAADFEIERSLRFNNYSASADDAVLSRTITQTSNRKTFTHSFWIKRSILGGEIVYGNDDSSGSYFLNFRFNGNHQIEFNEYRYNESPSNKCRLITTRVFRDVSAWYHIVVAVDTTQSTAADRVKIYVNGEQETSFGTAIYFDQNHDTYFNATAPYPVIRIGLAGWGYSGVNGYLAEFNAIDGLQLTPSSFGKTNVETGQWIPIDTSGLTFGTNGYRLNFSDNSGTTATTMGKDSSGNGNNFTPSNLAVSDSITDTPSKNFCTLNPLNKTNNAQLREGALEFFQSSNDESATATFGITSGKWYWEVYKNSSQNPELGIDTLVRVLSTQSAYVSNTKVMFRTNGGDQTNGAGSPISLTGSSSGQTGAGVIAIAVDFDNKKIWYSDLSGTFFNSGNPATGANEAFDFSSVSVANGAIPSVYIGTGGNNSCNFNFGQDGTFAGHTTAGGNVDGNGHGNFKYSVPSGYLALCSANLPDPTIKLPNKHFDTVLYSGSGSGTQNITSLNFQPDWVWLKIRSTGGWHALVDSVRGVGKILASNETDAENNSSDSQTAFSAFLSNGFTVGYNTSWYVNGSPSGSSTQVAWNWDAGETDSATYRVVVVSDSGNKYRFRNSANSATFAQSAVTLDLAEGGTYTFDGSDSTMASHPIKLSTTANGTHGGGSSYNTGVTYELDGSTVTESAYVSGYSSATSRKLIITVAASAPTLYYYCHVHSGMGGQINTNSTLGSSNFDGSNQTTVKANTTSGFSIVTWTGTGSVASMGHGLGVAPKVIWIKTRSATNNWVNYHSALGVSKYMHLSNDGAANSATNYFADDSGNGPSSTVFYGRNDGNTSSQSMVAYCFSEVAGYSKFGSYTGNGSSNGTFVFTGFRPAWVMIKRTSGTQNWRMFDNKRNPFNDVDLNLQANTSGAEFESSAYNALDFLSNGFKLVGTNADEGTNQNGQTYIYLAFAESPFKNARAR